MGRPPHSRFDLLHPDIYRKVLNKEDKVVQTNHRTVRKFSIGDNLFARNYSGTQKWTPVTVVKLLAQYHIMLKLDQASLL